MVRDMKKFAELKGYERNAPCQEYPGRWLVYYPNRKVEDQHEFPTFEEAYTFAKTKEGCFPEDPFLSPIHVSICWDASEDDPRIGKVWFTGFYQHGKFDQFGRYISS